MFIRSLTLRHTLQLRVCQPQSPLPVDCSGHTGLEIDRRFFCRFECQAERPTQQASQVEELRRIMGRRSNSKFWMLEVVKYSPRQGANMPHRLESKIPVCAQGTDMQQSHLLPHEPHAQGSQTQAFQPDGSALSFSLLFRPTHDLLLYSLVFPRSSTARSMDPMALFTTPSSPAPPCAPSSGCS